jgi:hypothetical protein
MYINIHDVRRIFWIVFIKYSLGKDVPKRWVTKKRFFKEIEAKVEDQPFLEKNLLKLKS